MKSLNVPRFVQSLLRVLRCLHPVTIAVLTTGLILTASIAIAETPATGWLFNGQKTVNEITLKGFQYIGDCATHPSYPDLSGSFISQKTPPAPHTRVIIKNITPGIESDPVPYTDREYDENRSSSEIANMEFSTQHHLRTFSVIPGKNTFEYMIKRQDSIVESGTFNAEITTMVRQEKRDATWQDDQICANNAVSMNVCADIRNRHAFKCPNGEVLKAQLTPNDRDISTRLYNNTGETLSFKFKADDYKLFPGEYATLRSPPTSSYFEKIQITLSQRPNCKTCHSGTSRQDVTPGKRYQFRAIQNGKESTIRLEEYPHSMY